MRFYLIAVYLVLLCLLFPVASFLFLEQVATFRDMQLERTLSQMRKSLEERGGALARNLALSAGQAIAGYDFTFLNILLAEVVNRDHEIVYCLLIDPSGRVISHNDPSLIGNTLDDPQTRNALGLIGSKFPQTLDAGRPEPVQFFMTDKGTSKQSSQVLEMIAPVYSGLRLAGILRCGYSLVGLQTESDLIKADWENKMQQFRYSIISLSTLFFAIGVVIAFLFTRRFEKATKILNAGVQRIAEGDLSHAIATDVLFCRELANYGETFNSMMVRLRETLHQLEQYSRSLEEKVADRTRALKEAQDEMLLRAHEAGMAEMAVGVLHNIGNAITPAKVDATLLLRRLRESALRNRLDNTMARIADGLRQPEVLEEGERQRLAEVVHLLPGSVREEYDQMARDVQRVRDKHEHIENIISLQMRYARLVGDSEEISINRVIDDALKILEDSIRNRKIKIMRNSGELPLVRFEQAKLIQILINLIKNAYEAMQDMEGDKILTITTEYTEEPAEEVSISIRDTGLGFAPEESEKLFRFGYTTKQTGSGFGLHTCANFVRANKGAISAYSDGIGKGAVFTVRLPVHPDV